jgi:hypothetical protein
MARPKKSKEERYVVKNIRFPPAIWAELVEAIPAGRRSAFIQEQVERALRQIRGQKMEEDDSFGDVLSAAPGGDSGRSTVEPYEERLETESAAERPLWEKIDELIQQVPDEEFARLPEDGSEQHDHYIYGLPKRQR